MGKRICLQCGRPGLDPELGRSPGGAHGNPLQYSGQENFVDYIVHGVAKSQTGLSDFHFHYPSLWEFLLFPSTGFTSSARKISTFTQYSCLLINQSYYHTLKYSLAFWNHDFCRGKARHCMGSLLSFFDSFQCPGSLQFHFLGTKMM